MRGGTKALWLTTVLSLASGCVSEGGQLNVRAIPNAIADAARKGSPLVVEARAQLRLGNVGLALEAFRKAQRMQPDSIEALAGIAECYERMGRHDLSRASYEAALAVAPNNMALLNTFAASLDRQGRRPEAATLRAEAVQAETAAIQSAANNLVVEAVGNTTWHVETTPAPRPAQSATAARLAPQPAASVTVELPAPRPARPRAAPPPPPAQSRLAQAVPAKPAEPLKVAAPAPAMPSLPARTKVAAVPAPLARPLAAPPRLERLSDGEVALLTGTGAAWRTEVVAQTTQSVTVRFVPLRTSSARPNIRLLNAARRQGLAARTRSVLLDRGWRRIAISDAPQVRDRSVVLYPAARKALGLRLAAQFGFRSEVSARDEGVVVLLGRDASLAPALRRRG